MTHSTLKNIEFGSNKRNSSVTETYDAVSVYATETIEFVRNPKANDNDGNLTNVIIIARVNFLGRRSVVVLDARTFPDRFLAVANEFKQRRRSRHSERTSS